VTTTLERDGGGLTFWGWGRATASVQALKFVLIDRKTDFWHKYESKGDFVVPLAGSSSSAPSRAPLAGNDDECPVELLQVWAFLRWDEAGRPEVTEAEKYAPSLSAAQPAELQ
jgi:hypothetical protein